MPQYIVKPLSVTLNIKSEQVITNNIKSKSSKCNIWLGHIQTLYPIKQYSVSWQVAALAHIGQLAGSLAGC